ncbi:MAG TPA: hypothetical protein VD968_15715, partial [Pyrinomonadaceae bacterium]|nr:hypothetical protein [Pyrinomonadaceae bacterium]
MRRFGAGDLVIVARGRRYFSNDAFISRLQAEARPAAATSLGGVPSAGVYVLDEASLQILAGALGR